MNSRNYAFDIADINIHEVLHELKHHLSTQDPFKVFIHPNFLHASQHENFYKELQKASELFGCKASLSLTEFRVHYQAGRIKQEVLERIISQKKGQAHVHNWLEKAIAKNYTSNDLPRIGSLRAFWKRQYRIDLDSLVHPTLFRILGNFLDQDVALWKFPALNQPFLTSIREMERLSYTSFFRTERAKNLLLYTRCDISELLQILVGDESLYSHYLFDQQFAHPTWSGRVSALEDQPESPLNTRHISLHDLILFELLLEIDALDYSFGDIWAPLGIKIRKKPKDLFAPIPETELAGILSIWQEAFEWSHHDEVLAGISLRDVAGKIQEGLVLQPSKLEQSQFRNMRSWMKALFGVPPEPAYPSSALCILSAHTLARSFFGDRRVSRHAYDYRADFTGRYLLDILQSAVPSYTDNGIRPDLPSPMPQPSEFMRALLVVEHFPGIVLDIIKSAPTLYAWFMNEWVHLVVVHPEARVRSVFRNGEFIEYVPLQNARQPLTDLRLDRESQPDGASFQTGKPGKMEQKKLTLV
jgi:uncharacterized protein YbcC (UPF0753/DUF2309 family)